MWSCGAYAETEFIGDTDTTRYDKREEYSNIPWTEGNLSPSHPFGGRFAADGWMSLDRVSVNSFFCHFFLPTGRPMRRIAAQLSTLRGSAEAAAAAANCCLLSISHSTFAWPALMRSF